MSRRSLNGFASVAALSLVMGAIFVTQISAQAVKVEGTITGRSGAFVTLKTSDAPALLVLLTDSTKVSQVQGVLKARRKQMSMAALIPGLPIKVEGSNNAQNQLVASSISFKGDDLEQAQAIQAGLQETQALAKQTAQQAELNKEQAELNKQKLAMQEAALAQQRAALSEEQQKVTANAAKIAANKKAIAAANKRFGELGDYNIMDEVTVYFGNGKVTIDPKYKPELTALAAKAPTITAYMIQVKGYASSSGSVALNQKLSEDRANNVAQFLQQQCRIPLTNMLAPGAMGESRQVGSDKTAEGEAQNRRVVVRVLQNKGIAGT
jgi:outer membrane protein OmpA-like peptidoglycan-associated protein